MVLKSIQAISGLTFGLYSSMHLGGHLLSMYDFELSNTALFANRELFHVPAVELTVIGGSLLVHSMCSCLLYLQRPNVKSKGSTQSPALKREMNARLLHRYTGWTLAVLMLAHIPATRLIPLYVLPDASVIDLTIVTKTLHDHPEIFIVYYTILGFAGMVHSFFGIQNALQILGISKPKASYNAWAWGSIFAVLAMGIVYSIRAYDTISYPDEFHMVEKWPWQLLHRLASNVFPI